MHLLSTLLRPGRSAEAHCDGPCGIYDPASARIAAEAVLSMAQKIVALGDADDAATNNTRSRFTAIKEEQAELAKRELNILWTDYFNPERTADYPDLWQTFWNAAKLCSRNKTELSVEAGEELLATIEEIHNVFWATKGRDDVPFYLAV